MTMAPSSSSAPSQQAPSSSISLASYSPISSLERQYAAGPRLLVFIRTNGNCCLQGGVEALLKMQQKSGQGAAISRTATLLANTDNSEDPFAFLSCSSDTTSTLPVETKKKTNTLTFLKNVAKKTTHHIERGMTGLAIRADQGRNPDTLIMALYDTHSGALWAMTEPQPLPATDHQRLKGCSFAIPLVVPAHILGNLTIQLFIRSGAALAKGKHYLLGQVQLNASQLQASLASSQRASILTLPLQSQVIVDGKIHMCITSDKKFPPLNGVGWSLTDPDMNGYAGNAFFHLPLDQSYGYSLGKQWFLATERSIESSVILPIATAFARLAQRAAKISVAHATSVCTVLRESRHDSLDFSSKASVTLGVGYLYTRDSSIQALLSLHWQRPDSIFEVEMVPSTRLSVQKELIPFSAQITLPFAPPVTTTGILPSILRSCGATKPPYLLGNIRLHLRVSSPHLHLSSDPCGSVGMEEQEETWQAIVPLEPYVNQKSTSTPLQIPVYNTASGIQMGTILLQLHVSMNVTPPASTPISSSAGGLVSLVGLDTLMEDNGGLPMLDYDVRAVPADPALQRRQQQLGTMGYFITHSYLQQHINAIRTVDAKLIAERSNKYQMALSFNPQGKEAVPSYEDKSPKPFRPSSSRLQVLLSGIPFNVHVQSLAVENAENASEGALFHNVTCGAPADHARGFANIISTTNGTDGANVSPVGPVSGGLRRLEAKRVELSKAVQDAQSLLINAVGAHLQASRQQNCPVHHVPVRHAETSGLRWRVFEATQALHHVTWTCAVRRANVFSQALGIAITSYLTSVSDVGKQGWPDLWVRHGYLMTYEGLLSAAGNELGMIEDASVGIAMLRMVSVVFVADDASSLPDRVAVPNSPYVKWVQLTPFGIGSNTQYRLEIGIDPQYYMQRIPEPLKNGAAVRLYPLFYEVGVDIRQWGAHQEMKMKDQLSTSGRLETTEPEQAIVIGGLLEDEDDDVGVADDDVLVTLNYEAFQKMNAYAHLISPAPSGGPGDLLDAPSGTIAIHPTLISLHAHIMSSAGKMNHSILDEAALLSLAFGGGGAVFCKSGKDRTAMHVTYKQAQFARRYLCQKTREGSSADIDQDQIYEDATLMRIYGTRLPICEKNVGQAKYAFNALQVKFMPEMLRPPPSTLAGFLKGGRLFTGGGIES